MRADDRKPRGNNSMNIDDFHIENDRGISFSRQQASRFAKLAANDFNPIHDEDAKLFCVPGDLLFAVTLKKYGLFQDMSFKFTGMVSDGVDLVFNQDDDSGYQLQDAQGKNYLEVSRNGDVTDDMQKIWQFVSSYIRFSGHNFPHILVPLMSEQGVMLNPNRPLAIYQSMSFELEHLTFEQVQLDLKSSTLDINGKKGHACMEFEVTDGAGGIIGKGQKEMLLRGLQPLDQALVEQMVADYQGFKEGYTG